MPLQYVNQEAEVGINGITPRMITDVMELKHLHFEDVSFFNPFLKQFAAETLLAGGEVYAVQKDNGAVCGLLLYDAVEKTGSIFTRSRDACYLLSGLKSKMAFFSELPLDLRKEIYLIYARDMSDFSFMHRFVHEVRLARDEDLPDVLDVMKNVGARINPGWIHAAFAAGEKCFIVRNGRNIAGAAWLAMAGEKGRLHSLAVSPQFRKQGIGTDLLFARLLWLGRSGAQYAFSEIAESNKASRSIAARGGMHQAGEMYHYFG